MSKCPSSIWRRDSNPRPFEHESSPTTTRPGLTSLKFLGWFQMQFYCGFRANVARKGIARTLGKCTLEATSHGALNVEWDEGCFSPCGKLLCQWQTPKNYAAHAWQHSILVWLLAWSSCSWLLLNYTTRKYKCMGVQPSGTLYMFTKLIYFFHSVNPCHHIWVAKDRKLHWYIVTCTFYWK